MKRRAEHPCLRVHGQGEPGIMQLHVNHMTCTPHSIRTACWTMPVVTITQECGSEPRFSSAAGDRAERCTLLHLKQLQNWQCHVLGHGTDLNLGLRNPIHGSLNRRCRRREWLPSHASTCECASFDKLKLRHPSSVCRLPAYISCRSIAALGTCWGARKFSCQAKHSRPAPPRGCLINIFMHCIQVLLLGKTSGCCSRVVQLHQG